MRLQDYRDAFYTFTEKASDLNRQLAFAAIAIIWLFKKDVGGQPSIPVQLILPGILIVSSLVFDMLHYCALRRLFGVAFIAVKRMQDSGKMLNCRPLSGRSGQSGFCSEPRFHVQWPLTSSSEYFFLKS